MKRVIAGAAFVLIILLISMIRIRTKQKAKKEAQFQAMKKIRENSLKEALANQMEEDTDINAGIPYRPYKVEYSTGEEQEAKEKRPMLQIIEKNKLAEKNYIFRADDTVILGLQFGIIAILHNTENAEAWCEFFFQNGSYCIRSLGKGKAYVQRKRKTAIIDKVGIRLKSGDIIQLQKTTFQIFYVKG